MGRRNSSRSTGLSSVCFQASLFICNSEQAFLAGVYVNEAETGYPSLSICLQFSKHPQAPPGQNWDKNWVEDEPDSQESILGRPTASTSVVCIEQSLQPPDFSKKTELQSYSLPYDAVRSKDSGQRALYELQASSRMASLGFRVWAEPYEPTKP